MLGTMGILTKGERMAKGNGEGRKGTDFDSTKTSFIQLTAGFPDLKRTECRQSTG